MKLQSQTIEAILLYTNALDVLRGSFDENSLCLDHDLDKEQLVRQLRHVFSCISLDQIRSIIELMEGNWLEGHKEESLLYFKNKRSIFNMFLNYSNSLLELRDGMPVCVYEKILQWQELICNIGEDVLVTNYLASSDIKRGVPWRRNFAWDVYLNHTNRQLDIITSRPLTDLHSHLKGASLVFELSWLCLMNHIQLCAPRLREWRFLQNPYVVNRSTEKTASLYKLAILAAAIRVYLFGHYYNLSLCDLRSDIFQAVQDPLDVSVNDLMKKVNSACHILRSSLYDSSLSKCIKQKGHVIDYACRHNVVDYSEERTLIPLVGERCFMYMSSRRILESEEYTETDTLYFAYLIIKAVIRNEMVQSNSTLGFNNFALYDERKSELIKGIQPYEQLQKQLSVALYFYKDAEHRYLETRISPWNTFAEQIQNIRENDRDISMKDELIPIDNWGEKGQWKYHYITHFIKRKDNPQNIEREDKCRDYDLRKDIRKQAIAIAKVRQSVNVAISNRIVGIDAANSEIACRPEVFAQAFRYLHHQVSRTDATMHPKAELGRTFHVGEDFWSIVDGLRAVDEVLEFMNFSDGDRLGHALVLGTDVKSYYESRQYSIAMPQQVILDNAVWLYHKLLDMNGYSRIAEKILRIFYIYAPRCHYNILDPRYFYLSWKLRGDAPELYRGAGRVNLEDAYYGGLWQQCGLNDGLDNKEARDIDKVCLLNYMYHYDPAVKSAGSKVDLICIDHGYRKDFIQAVEAVQQELLRRVEKARVVIECNPSSNYKIGEMNRYDEHPIWLFNNYSIHNEDREVHQLSVTINTDDCGLFSTSIEREYALLACAKEKRQRDLSKPLNPKDIYRWLDSVREQGWYSRFNKNMYVTKPDEIVFGELTPITPNLDINDSSTSVEECVSWSHKFKRRINVVVDFIIRIYRYLK